MGRARGSDTRKGSRSSTVDWNRELDWSSSPFTPVGPYPSTRPLTPSPSLVKLRLRVKTDLGEGLKEVVRKDGSGSPKGDPEPRWSPARADDRGWTSDRKGGVGVDGPSPALRGPGVTGVVSPGVPEAIPGPRGFRKSQGRPTRCVE